MQMPQNPDGGCGAIDMQKVRDVLDAQGVPWLDVSGTLIESTVFEVPEQEKWDMVVRNGASTRLPLGTVEVSLFCDGEPRGQEILETDALVGKIQQHDWEL